MGRISVHISKAEARALCGKAPRIIAASERFYLERVDWRRAAGFERSEGNGGPRVKVFYNNGGWSEVELTDQKGAYQPKTGAPCSCRRGIERDNCPACEGTGMQIDFAAIRARRV